MPARILVYNIQPVGTLDPDDLVRELRDADLMTLAEALELPEGEVEAVREMWRHFRLDADGPFTEANLHWHATKRPIQIRVGAPLPGELVEMLDNLPESDEPGAIRVREQLRATREVVELEMGIDGPFHLAATIAEVLAFWIAELGGGIVWFYHREFVSPENRGGSLWMTGD